MLTLNPRRHVVLTKGKEIYLSPKEFLIAKYALENKGYVFSRQDVIKSVWPIPPKGFGVRTVDQHIARLRSKLRGVNFLKTVPGFGYKAVDGKIVNG